MKKWTPALAIMNVRTCNSPELLQRFFNDLKKQISIYGQPSKKFIINIIDDSSTHDNDYSLIISKARDNFPFKVNYVKTSQAGLVSRIKEYSSASEDAIKIFQTKGNRIGGVIGALNLAILYSNFLIGASGEKPKDTIITFHDDDLLFSILSQNKSNEYKIIRKDLFGERNKLFSDYSCLVSTGRVTHHSGNPYRMLVGLLDFSNLLIEDLMRGERTDKSSIQVFNGKKGIKYTIKETWKKFPLIVKTFNERKPITGLYTEKINKGIEPKNTTCNGGQLSIRGTNLLDFYTPPFTIQDLILTGKLKEKIPLDSFRIETGMRHYRERKDNNSSASGEELINAVQRKNDAPIYDEMVKLIQKRDYNRGKNYKIISNERELPLRTLLMKTERNIAEISRLEKSKWFLNEKYSQSIAELHKMKGIIYKIKRKVYPIKKNKKAKIDAKNILKNIQKNDVIWKNFMKSSYNYGKKWVKEHGPFPKYIFISFDIDGTLRKDRSDSIPPDLLNIRKRIEETVSTGNTVFIVNTNNITGEAVEIGSQLGFDYASSEGGAFIKKLTPINSPINTTLSQSAIEKIKKLKKQLLRKKIRIFRKRKGSIYVRSGEKYFKLPKKLLALDKEFENIFYYTPNNELKGIIRSKKVDKFSVFKLVPNLSDNCTIVHFGDDILDVPKKSQENIIFISSSFAMDKISDQAKIKVEEHSLDGILKALKNVI